MKAILEATREKLARFSQQAQAQNGGSGASPDSRFDGVVPLVVPPSKKGETNTNNNRRGRTYTRDTLHHPALLEEINDMITTGLKRLKEEREKASQLLHEIHERSDTGAQSDRLALYRTAFQRYIDESSIYKQFLTAFMHEYDRGIDELREQVRSLSSVRLELPMQLAENSDRFKLQALEHKKSTEELLRRVSQLEGALAQTQRKLSLTEAEYRDYCVGSETMRGQWEEMRVSCIRLTNSLQRHEDEKKRAKVADASRQAEFVAAKINEHKSQEQAERLTIILQEMEAVQSTLVTKEAVEEQLSLIKHLRAELKNKEDQHRDFISRYSTLKAAIESSYAASEARGGGKSSSSDRSDVLVVDGVTLSGRTIRACVEKLLNQVANLQSSLGVLENQLASDEGTKEILDDADAATEVIFHSPWSHFEALGMHAHIPPYLRAVGRVQNFFMSRRDAAKLIREIMGALRTQEQAAEDNLAAAMLDNSSLKRDAVMPPKAPFSVFFEKYLTNKYCGKGVEVAYNLIDCLKKYSQESDCRLFSMLLEDVLPSDIWFDLSESLAAITETMKREESRQYGNVAAKRLSIEAFIRLLKKILPNKTEMSIARVSRALALETSSNRLVDLDRCLAEKDFTWSIVSEELRQQYINEIIEFVDSVSEQVESSRDSPSELHSTLADLREALLRADPKKPRAEVNSYLARGCGVSLEQMLLMEAKRVEIPLEDFMRRLRSGLLKKSQ